MLSIFQASWSIPTVRLLPRWGGPRIGFRGQGEASGFTALVGVGDNLTEVIKENALVLESAVVSGGNIFFLQFGFWLRRGVGVFFCFSTGSCFVGKKSSMLQFFSLRFLVLSLWDEIWRD